jgi:hypothetical protein
MCGTGVGKDQQGWEKGRSESVVVRIVRFQSGEGVRVKKTRERFAGY